ncbi:hypothetical protein PFISCL1PPCAC_22777, partial [Pristionchus fissidentatus]
NGKVLDRIELLANERGLGNKPINNVLHTLRYNLSSVLTPDERSMLGKCVQARNTTSLEELFEQRYSGIGRNGPHPQVVDGVWHFRNSTDDLIGNWKEHGREFHNRSDDFIDRYFGGNLTDGKDFAAVIKEKFGNDTAFFDKLTNFTGIGNFSKMIEDVKAGNFSMLERLFNGTGSSNSSGAMSKIIEAVKLGKLSGLLNGGSGANSSGMLDKLKSLLNVSPPGSSGSSDPSTALSGFGSNLPSSFKSLFT